jgi:hypothetical protein
VTNEERLFLPFTEGEFDACMKEMLAVFTADCAMELVFAGERWAGHDGARKFYQAFLSSFEGMRWVPQALVIGPQGVLDVVNMTGRLVKPFAGFTNVGEAISQQWTIYFPWDTKQHVFRGEIIYSIRPLIGGESVSVPFARGQGRGEHFAPLARSSGGSRQGYLPRRSSRKRAKDGSTICARSNRPTSPTPNCHINGRQHG